MINKKNKMTAKSMESKNESISYFRTFIQRNWTMYINKPSNYIYSTFHLKKKNLLSHAPWRVLCAPSIIKSSVKDPKKGADMISAFNDEVRYTNPDKVCCPQAEDYEAWTDASPNTMHPNVAGLNLHIRLISIIFTFHKTITLYFI